MRKYVTKTASEKRSQANSAFFLSWVLLKMEVNSRSITAKAQGLILSASAAKVIGQKKPSLVARETAEAVGFVVFSSDACWSVMSWSLASGVLSADCSSIAKLPQILNIPMRAKERRHFVRNCIVISYRDKKKRLIIFYFYARKFECSR
jgi:hypothetical protein